MKQEINNLLIPFNINFCQLFLNSPLEIKFFGQNLCLSLYHAKAGVQIVTVLPQGSVTSLPTPRQIANRMNRSGKTTKNLRELPISYSDLLKISGFYLEYLALKNRFLYVFYATYEDLAQVTLADHILVGLDVELDSEQKIWWPPDNQYHVLLYERFEQIGRYNIFALIKMGVELEEISNLEAIAKATGDKKLFYLPSTIGLLQ